jgi:cytochrome c-type biogenesis protein CcmH/NrfF
VLPVAHVGHWIVYVLYAVPVLIVLASIVFTVVRDRRRGPADQETSPPA